MTGAALLAVVLSAAAAALCCGAQPERRLAALAMASRDRALDRPAEQKRPDVAAWARGPRSWLLVLAVGGSAAALAGATAAGLGATAAVAVARAVRSRRREAQTQARRTAVVDVALALAGELRAGQPLAAALTAATEVAGPLAPFLAEAAGAAAMGGDPTPALRTAAELPGAAGLRAIAAAWRVAAEAGAALSDALAAVAAALEQREQTRHEVVAQLAGPRATGRALLGLPLVGVAMAASIGAHPGQLLLHTVWGGLLCGGAVMLVTAGTVWMERLARKAAPP